MSTKETKEPKEPKHRPEALRLPQRKDSLTQVLTYIQGKTIPPKAASTVSSASTQSAPASPAQGLSKPRRHSHGPDVKKKARTTSTTLRRFSFTNLTGIMEETGAKTKNPKASEGTPGNKNAKSGSSEKVNKTNTSKSQAPSADKSQEKVPSSPPPMPKSILRVASPDAARPPPRHIRSYSTSAASPGADAAALSPIGLTPLTPTDSSLDPLAAESGTLSQPTSPVFRPLSPGATVRFAKATIHRVDVGPGRRFAPVKRRSKSTMTYIAPLDPVSNVPKFSLQSPTKLRRHQENQAAMGRYWLRTEEEEAQMRAEAERRAAEEAERYRAEPSSPIASADPPKPSWAERLAALDKLGSLDGIPLLDKTEVPAKSDAEDKLETVEASESDDSDAESDGGASTMMDKEEDVEGVEPEGKSEKTEKKKAESDVEKQANPAEASAKPDGGSTVQATPPEPTPPKPGEPEKTDPAVGKPLGSRGPETAQAAPVTSPETKKSEPTKAETPKTPASLMVSTTPATQQRPVSVPAPIPTPIPTPAPATTSTLAAPKSATTKTLTTTSTTSTATKASATTPTTPKTLTTTTKTTTASTATSNPTTNKSSTPSPSHSTSTSPTTATQQHPTRTTAPKTLRSSRSPSPTQQQQRPTNRPLSPRPLSPPRPSSPALKHKKSMATLNGTGTAGNGGGLTNHLHLSGRRGGRRYVGEGAGVGKQEIAA